MTFVESLSQWLSKFISNPSEYIKNQNFWWLLFNNNKSNWANDTSSEAVWQRITNTRTAAQWRSKQQVLTDLLNSHQTMYTSALINRNNTASKQDMKDAQLDAFAALVKSRAIEDWDTDWDEYNTTADIVGHYIDLKNSPEVNKRLIEYANSQDDPYNFAMEMWVLLSPEDKRIREIQKGYEAVKDARDTYNKYGKITVDQAQELIDTDLRLLAKMEEEESAYHTLANAKLEEMKVQLARNAIDTLNSLKTEADAVEYLAMANVNLRNQTLSANEALLQQTVLMKRRFLVFLHKKSAATFVTTLKANIGLCSIHYLISLALTKETPRHRHQLK